MAKFVLGIDYGTNSVRTVVVDCADGAIAGTHVFDYPSGEQGVLLDARDHNLARQNPADYIEGLEVSATKALAASGCAAADVIGIGVDTTGSTPIPVDESNTPLAFQAKFAKDPAAQAWLWKDHTGLEEAARITEMAREHRPQYLAKCGNTYSAEWFWAKLWKCLNCAPEVFDAAYSWVEFSDYIPAVLAGVRDSKAVVRGVCAAGHKAMYCDEWDGYPDAGFLAMLDPKLAALRGRLSARAHDANTPAGTLCEEWAAKLGLAAGVPIAIGAFDAHLGAVGAGVAEGTLVKIMGTSACDCTVAPVSRQVEDIPGICGIVKGSILPDHYGIEAGQSAVGDIFKWWVEGVCGGDDALHAALSEETARRKPGRAGLLALDWNNGNRTVLADPKLSGLLLGQSLYTTRAEIYRALIEGTAFGARVIIERLRGHGVPIERIICCGGLAEKNPMLMQIYADVTGCAMEIAASGQTCALGAAISAAVAAGGHRDFASAQAAMTRTKPEAYRPKPENQAVYDELYALYLALHDAFGGVRKEVDLSRIMKRLLSIKEAQN